MPIRIIPTNDGWWCTAPGQAALLPPDAYIDGQLVEEARSALAAHGFFRDKVTEFSVTVLTATTCNLGCAYCFQNLEQGAKNPYAPPRIKASMVDETAIANIHAFVRRRMRTLGLSKLSVLLFGGEPLLNLDGCTKLLSSLNPLGMHRAHMVTNAVLLRPNVAQQLQEAGPRWSASNLGRGCERSR